MRNRGGVAEKGSSPTLQGAILVVVCSRSGLSVTGPQNSAVGQGRG